MVLYLGRMCQCGLHAVLWSHIGTQRVLLAADPRRPAGLLFLGQYVCGTILESVFDVDGLAGLGWMKLGGLPF